MAANRSSNNNPQGNNQSTQAKGNSQSGNRGNGQGGGVANRGFASMDPQRQREIAAEGGRAAHASGNAHEFTSEEARRAGALSHKNDGNRQSASAGNGQSGNRGNSQADNSQSAGNQSGNRQGSKGVQGGTPEQHAAAGRQSHKHSR
ncbi:stress-induced protein [Massilia dura]|uniref:Stress-induced protein n=1 Tax=Pseudoduganella dura TaxID=321982 RepID=A0A6I3XWF6_9BURK|nr:KGG domain-containing protein [Pseudoduganella dura]MUI16095.1 stress-induced protein [Pseudoduganella dura]GGY11825.1 hypothetical protein GCM10007386_47630 [Pseudoduganella dura]